MACFEARVLVRKGRNRGKAIVLFLATGLAEIGGGYLVWLWLRESKPL
jgi:hypothetical protein